MPEPHNLDPLNAEEQRVDSESLGLVPHTPEATAYGISRGTQLKAFSKATKHMVGQTPMHPRGPC